MAVGQKWVSPSEFWALTPTELWWLVEANKKEDTGTSMSESEIEEIYRETYGE
ncbi:MAG: phage tail assembly chaperone [Saprospiraceae bacterium]